MRQEESIDEKERLSGGEDPYGGGVGNRQIENGDKFPYGGGAMKPSASACSTAVQVRVQERDLEKRRRQRFEQGGHSFARRR